MRLRHLLAATAVSALLVGAVGVPAHSLTPPAPANAGTVVTWGNEADPDAAAAMSVPEDLTGPVRSVAANARATGVVTLDGAVRVWGTAGAPEVDEAPAGVTDAEAISLTLFHGAILHTDGRVTAWGLMPAVSEVPSDLRAKAIALQVGTGYAVRTDGTLAVWGNPPGYPVPSGLSDLVDVSAATSHAMALKADGTVVMWGAPEDEAPGLLLVPDFGGKKVVQIATGPMYSGVIFEDGTIATWGAMTPAGQPDLDGLTPGEKAVSLSMAPVFAGQTAAAVTADGAVHTWGGTTSITTVPAALTGTPVSAIALGQAHAAVVVTAFRDLTKPTVTGTPTVGQTLTATPATFSLTPDAPATGQWYAGSDPIAGQTATTLPLDSRSVGKSISYRTTATRDGQTITSASTPVGPVPSVASSIAVGVDPASAAVGSTRTVTATVTSTSGTPAGSVTFTVGSSTVAAPLSGGKATWILPALAVGSHSVTAAYSGDSATAPSSAATTVTVTEVSSGVSGKVRATGKTKKVAKKVTITLTVTSAMGVSPVGEATVRLKGATKKTVTATVDATGKATVTVKRVKRGKYTAEISYAGNANVLDSTGAVKFKV